MTALNTEKRLARESLIIPLCDGIKTSQEIAGLLGESAKYVQRVMKRHDLPRLPQSARRGQYNPSYVYGRSIDRDGYAVVSAPLNHPYQRNVGTILEHRLIVEKSIGRFLFPSEVVDHIDGLRLHNNPSNLRLFGSNADHLKETITGNVPKWSSNGRAKQFLTTAQRINSQRIDTYLSLKKSGAARLIEILRTSLILGIDSPYLLGSSTHLEKAGIVDFSHSNLERELELLYQKYA